MRSLLFILGIFIAIPLNAEEGSSSTYCQISTYCPQSGRTVHCSVYADAWSGQRCSYSWQVGIGVRCIGVVTEGSWGTITENCN